jgi:hypothetical protein
MEQAPPQLRISPQNARVLEPRGVLQVVKQFRHFPKLAQPERVRPLGVGEIPALGGFN